MAQPIDNETCGENLQTIAGLLLLSNRFSILSWLENVDMMMESKQVDNG